MIRAFFLVHAELLNGADTHRHYFVIAVLKQNLLHQSMINFEVLVSAELHDYQRVNLRKINILSVQPIVFTTE